MNKHQCIWLWQLSVYSPSSFKVKKQVTENGKSAELDCVIYPYRQGNFNLNWLSVYHPDDPWYWDKNYVQKQNDKE